MRDLFYDGQEVSWLAQLAYIEDQTALPGVRGLPFLTPTGTFEQQPGLDSRPNLEPWLLPIHRPQA